MARPYLRLVEIVLLLAPVVAMGQSLAAGLGLENGEEHYGPGVYLQASFTTYARREFALHVDLSYATFSRQGPEMALCALPCAPSTGETVKVVSASAEAELFRGTVFSWLAGADVYHFIETPFDGSYTRPAWNTGVSISLDRRFYFDMRYHGLIGPRETTRGFGALLLGVRL